jgi:uncharacterized protein with ParB-like and HNH nuclease domain
VKDDSYHYFGIIASKVKNESKDGKNTAVMKIIDGQQRLTTSLILLVYLGDRAKEVSSEFLNLLKMKNGNAFEHEMDSDLKDNIKHLLSPNISLLKGQFKKNFIRIKERLDGCSNIEIQKMYNSFSEKFIVGNLIYTIKDSDEMLIFENLNSKGSPLKSFDLIRNHIISLCSSNEAKTNLILFNKKI